MDFCTKRKNDKGIDEFGWHRMQFRQDLIDHLKRYGRLPFESIHESMQHINDLEDELQKLKDEISALKGGKPIKTNAANSANPDQTKCQSKSTTCSIF